MDQACQGARLLTISFVQYLGGQRADLLAIGEICHRRGCLFMVDAIQGLGAFPIDVRKARIHALAADGHKWLLGPEGAVVVLLEEHPPTMAATAASAPSVRTTRFSFMN